MDDFFYLIGCPPPCFRAKIGGTAGRGRKRSESSDSPLFFRYCVSDGFRQRPAASPLVVQRREGDDEESDRNECENHQLAVVGRSADVADDAGDIVEEEDDEPRCHQHRSDRDIEP